MISQSQDLLGHLHRLLWRLDGVSDGPLVLVDVVVVASLLGPVSKEVDLPESLVLHEAKAEPLVPPGGEDVDGDLPADGKVQPGCLGGELLQYPPAAAKGLILIIETAATVSIAAILVALFTGR